MNNIQDFNKPCTNCCPYMTDDQMCAKSMLLCPNCFMSYKHCAIYYSKEVTNNETTK